MNDTFIISTLLLSCFTNGCLSTLFYYKTIGLKPKIKKVYLVGIILVLAVLSSMLLFMGNFNIVSLFIVIIIYPVLFMGGRIKERIFFGIMSCIMTQFANLISMSIVSYNMVWNTKEYFHPISFLLSAILANIIYGLLALVVIHFDSNGKKYLPKKYWSGCLVVALIIFLFGTFIFTLDIWFDESKRDSYTVVFILGLLIVWLLLYFIYYFICKYFYLANEANLLAAKNEMMEKFLLQKQASDERIKILSHDLKHSLIQWRLLAAEKNDDNALRSIKEYENQLAASSIVDVGNESANAVINQKALEAYQQNVTFSVDGFINNDLIVNKLDICALLGNLLDNAIEAASMADSEGLRLVKLEIKRKGSILMIMLENGYSIAPIVQNGVFLSTKKDKEHHAIGMISIRRVAEKYHGTVSNAYENNWFKAAVMMTGYKTALSDEN